MMNKPAKNNYAAYLFNQICQKSDILDQNC